MSGRMAAHHLLTLRLHCCGECRGEIGDTIELPGGRPFVGIARYLQELDHIVEEALYLLNTVGHCCLPLMASACGLVARCDFDGSIALPLRHGDCQDRLSGAGAKPAVLTAASLGAHMRRSYDVVAAIAAQRARSSRWKTIKQP